MSKFPDDWQTVPLGSAAKWLSGGTPSTHYPQYWGGNIPWISAASLKSFWISDSNRRLTELGAAHGTRLVPAGTTIFVVRGMSLKNEFRVGVTTREVAFGQDCKALIPTSGIDSVFLGYAIAAQTDVILRMVGESGHGTGRLPTKQLLGLTIGVPSISEQRGIRKILEAADTAIEHMERLIAKLEIAKQGFLQDLLTCGLNKLGRLRNANLQPSQFHNTSLGLLPRDWDVVSANDIAESITSGSRAWAAYYAESGTPFLRIGNLTRNNINLRLTAPVFVRPPMSAELRRTAAESEDVLISITADLGIIGVVPDSLGEAYVSQHIALVRPAPKSLGRWVGYFLSSQRAQAQFAQLNDAGAKAGLNLPAVGHLKIGLPRSASERELIIAMLDSFENDIVAHQTSLAKLRSIKQGLMDDLLTGRVRVRA